MGSVTVNTSKQNLRRRTRRRARSRGAAMVEGIVVVSTMLIFLGLIVWTRQAYGMKLDLQQQTRSDALYYASHACEGSVGSAQQGTGGVVPGDNPAAGPASKASTPDKAAVSRSWNSASASANGRALWQAVWDVNATGAGRSIRYGRMPLTSNVSAASNLTCNERKYNSQLTAWLRFGADMVTRGGGFADLFR